jgi:hypothetical protein
MHPPVIAAFSSQHVNYKTRQRRRSSRRNTSKSFEVFLLLLSFIQFRATRTTTCKVMERGAIFGVFVL